MSAYIICKSPYILHMSPCTHLLVVVIVWTLYSLEHIKVCTVHMRYVLVCWVSPLLWDMWCAVFTEWGSVWARGLVEVSLVEDWNPLHILHVIYFTIFTCMHIFMGRIFLQVCENEMLNLWNFCMECGHHMRSFLFLALHYKTSTETDQTSL